MNSSATLLLVDDVDANRQTLRALLETENYRFFEADNGPTGLQLAAETRPDLVLLDVMMPGMDGYEVCRRLRADAILAKVPVIMITALDDSRARLAGIEAGADDFIVKPFNGAELRARVRTITRLNRYRRLFETQALLRESEARFQKLAEHSEDGFWFTTVNPDRVTFVSPAVEKIWGLPAARFYEVPSLWIDVLHPDDRVRVAAEYGAVATGASSRFEMQYRVVKPDGDVRWVLDSGTPIRDAAGAITSIGGVARDITERKTAEEQLLRAQRIENIGMLAAGIAHDFNNALAPILMAGPLLLPQINDPGGRRILGLVEKSAERSVALVRQLLSFARGSDGRRQLLQVRHVLKEMIDFAESTFPKSIRIEAHLPGDLWPVQADPTQVHQIVLNLCINARDAMPQGGQITLTASNVTLDVATAAAIQHARAGQFLMIEVEDSGTGIPPDVLARIWEPFFTTKGDGKGTGLGLSTVRGIIANHGGFVTVKTRLGHGTTFRVYLPAAENPMEASHAGTGDHALPRGQGELVLVVDDEDSVRTTAALILNRNGYQTITACDGADAIAVFAPRAADIRLVITDFSMPVLGGSALAATLRRLNPTLPIVAMSGVDSKASASFKEFAQAFLAKPFQPNTLLLVVRRALDEATLPTSVPSSH